MVGCFELFLYLLELREQLLIVNDTPNTGSCPHHLRSKHSSVLRAETFRATATGSES